MELTIEQALQQGIAAHNEGKLQDAERLYRAILQSQPAHPDANHNLGVLAVSINKADAALPLFKSALEANPKIEQFWLSYIDALIKEQQIEAAKQVIQQAKNQGVGGEKLNSLNARLAPISQIENADSSNPSEAQLSSLLECYQNGRLNDAEKLATSITQKYPTHPFSWKVLGAVLKQTGRTTESLTAMQTSAQLAPQDAEAHSNLGVTLNQLGRFEEAEASYKQAIALKPDYAEVHSNLGAMLQELGRFDEAKVSNTQAIVLEPDYVNAHFNLGNTLQELGRLDEAGLSFKQAIVLQPDFAEAHTNLGNTFQQLGRLDEAYESFTQAIMLKSDLFEAHCNLGVTLQELGRLDEAEASYTRAIMLKPDSAGAHSQLGDTFQELGRLEEAHKSYTKAIELQPEHAEVHSNLGNTFQKLGRLDEAYESFTQAIMLKSDLFEAHCNLGVTLQELGRLDEAEASYTRAIMLNPHYTQAHGNLGNTLQELGRLDEAEASYKQAIAYDPDFAQAYSHLGVLLYINGDIDSGLENLEKANNIDITLNDNKTILTILKARKARGITEISANNISNLSCSAEQFRQPVILKRAVEAELIPSLYKMKSIELDKFDNSRLSDPRFGDGKCSRDFKVFEDDSPIIKSVEEDLTIIMREVVNSDIYISESFFNILGAGGGTTPHAHVSKLDKDKYLNFGKQKYSLVYYLSVGDQNCRNPGILKLYDPGEDILPYEGMIVIFPADRKHSAVYGGEKDRVMIGVNFYSL